MEIINDKSNRERKDKLRRELIERYNEGKKSISNIKQDEREKEERRFDMEITIDKLRESETGRKIIELIGEEELYKYDPESLNSLYIDAAIKYSREQKENRNSVSNKTKQKRIQQHHTIQLAERERAIERCERLVRMESDKEDFFLSIRGQRHEDFVLHMETFEQRL
ncbi:unnamed protein product [Rotaria magnacalcarata]|uniref:Uncharacterized protein n=1 Tax=Rotaria magnacalcarata TaxID=392030 RepID=A0A815XPB3_9BILA|nr:unnamed protein product [Rotaria magnacalcarata]CAF1560073.1 unnamed protein product [Rotaria magnacalcarata]CAF3849046.1 unnamed protein product [Rotaria magnacalcarata]CAF3859669.1 unnamed protein product [Rotaria magnacalcarata]